MGQNMIQVTESLCEIDKKKMLLSCKNKYRYTEICILSKPLEHRLTTIHEETCSDFCPVQPNVHVAYWIFRVVYVLWRLWFVLYTPKNCKMNYESIYRQTSIYDTKQQ